MAAPETVSLHDRFYPEGHDAPAEGPPLVVLHGLYGSSRNWGTVARALARHGPVHALDLRNHGRSPHHPEMSYEAMAADVERWLDDAGFERCALMGHSLGGKVAMRLACDAPERIHRLYVLDIAPKGSKPDPRVLDALLAVDLDGVERRSDVEEQLESEIPDPEIRKFLLTNLSRDDDGNLEWAIPLEILRDQLDEIHASPVDDDDRYEGPTRFIVGGDSDYFGESDLERARRFFPEAELVVLDGVGHNVHVEGGDAFVDAVGDWQE